MFIQSCAPDSFQKFLENWIILQSALKRFDIKKRLEMTHFIKQHFTVMSSARLAQKD